MLLDQLRIKMMPVCVYCNVHAFGFRFQISPRFKHVVAAVASNRSNLSRPASVCGADDAMDYYFSIFTRRLG